MIPDVPRSPDLLVPSNDRLLRGALGALEALDVAGRADLDHSLEMISMVLRHLLARENSAGFPAIHADAVRLAQEGAARFAGDTLTHPIHSAIRALPATIEAGNFDVAQRQIGEVFLCLRDVTGLAAARGIAAGDAWLSRMQQIEKSFYAALPGPARSEPLPIAMIPFSHETFEAYLLDRFPGKYVRLASFERLVGGFQKDTIVFDAELATGGLEAMVIRADKPDRIVRLIASDVADEYAIVRAVRDKGIAVAPPLWLETGPNPFGRSFMVSSRVAGRNVGNAVGSLNVYSPDLAASFVRTLVDIHGIDVDDAITATKLGSWLQHSTLAANTRAEIADWRDQIWLRSAPPSPVFARAFDWLEANIPDDEDLPCVVHNDFGPHNILVEGERVSAVLDWEVARIGDPAEDLANFLHCAGPAVGHREATAYYEALSGRRIGEFRLRYFDILSIAKVLVATISANILYQNTEPALIDWVQMPLLWHGHFLGEMEDKIAAAERCS